MSDKNTCEVCKLHLVYLTKSSDLTNLQWDLLKRPRRVYTFNIPVKMDNGQVKLFDGYRVQYNDALGPTKGGIRFHHHVDLQEVEVLAFLMALKCSLVGLPYGGAKGGVEVDPKTLSKAELERLSRGYIQATHKFIGPHQDIPAPDINTDGQIMAWMVDEYAKIKGKFIPGVITGKPIELGGTLGRKVATSMGGFYILEKLLAGKNPQDIKIAIQGFGNVGGNLAKILYDHGYKIVAVSDSQKAIYNPEGLNIKEIFEKQINKRKVPLIETEISNKELLELDVDVLIPAAIADQITKENVNEIKAKIILEMANGPVTPEADEILFSKGVKVIPDILANSGGVIVSYFEWVQNSTNEYWEEEIVFKKLKEKITSALDRVLHSCETKKCNLRDTAHWLAIKKILEAEKARGNI